MSEQQNDTMEKVISLCKRRGFIYQGSEIYGGLAGTFDYGPLGVALKNRVKDIWWKQFVEGREDMYGVDAALIMNRRVWEASGHVGGFNDPMVEDLKTKKRYRADHILEDAGVEGVTEMTLEQMDEVIREKGVKSPDGNDLGEVRQFNMMLKTEVGALGGEDAVSYLRPETAQGMFVNFKNVVDSFSPKLPFGLGQIGKAFRNEIAPRDFIFRVREFEQMEVEYFVHPDTWKEHFAHWQAEIHSFIKTIGLPEDMVHELEVEGEDRAHYSERTIDFEFDYPFGRKELYGLAYRTDYDLKKHMEHSKTKLQFRDDATNEVFIPHVIEPSLGLDRTILAILTSAYTEDVVDGNERVFLKLAKEVAPVQVAVSPLLKNKPELVEKAREIFGEIKKVAPRIMFDDNGNIGKRYRRQDEIGTPYCVVIDFDTLEDGTVTIRERDTGEQKRVSVEEVIEIVK